MEGGRKDRSLLCPDVTQLNVSSVAIRRVCVSATVHGFSLMMSDSFKAEECVCILFGDI